MDNSQCKTVNYTSDGDCRTLPNKGEALTIQAYGKTLTIKRNASGVDWHAFASDSRHTRFGNASEIRSDMAHFIETGTLPRSKTCWH